MPPYDAHRMRSLPKGSLGRTYINFRVLQTHDLHHILTGFSLDNFGEFGVVSLSVSQYNFPAFAFLNLAAMLMTWMQHAVPVDADTPAAERAMSPRGLFEVVSQGLAMGEDPQPLFPVPWEPLLERDLEDLRRELGIQRVLSGIRSWASNPAVIKVLAA
jgi:ubiquinone biosynthesis protein Coq4